MRNYILIVAYLHFVLQIFNLSNRISLLFDVNTGTGNISDNQTC